MSTSSSFKIYNASAGSGKTYTLVKEYLKILFESENLFKFRQILAMTFTNKAVGEMKERILEMLKLFSNEEILKEPNSMFLDICQDLNMDKNVVHAKSKKILEIILHNYGAFDISTIDRFNHKIIRTFAHDLKLPQNFEVELDTDSLLNKAVDNLISKTGFNKELTKVLVEFALEKTDDDKSWDISFDLNRIAKLLVNENHISHLDILEQKSIDDFKALKKNVIEKTIVLEQKIIDEAKSVLSIIEECGLMHTDFTRGTLPNHFKKLVSFDLYKLYDNQLESNLAENKNIYNKTLSEDLASIINSILPQIESAFLSIKENVLEYKFLKNIYQNLTPLTVLNAINQELNLIKDEQNILLISEFNSVISNEIKNQPIPFIYERIGEKYKHYFIDEFQDTSELQWLNLIPLLENSLSSENGSTMLVGDAKQAIYRWRGGKAEQFISLFNEKQQPFPIKQSVKDLPVNYRSCKQIVSFNNDFFNYLSALVFSNPEYATIYSKCRQESDNKYDGLVDINLLDISREDDRNQVYCQKVFETIQTLLTLGYELKDICILVRKGIEGIAIADLLSNQGIPIISSETLLLDRSPEIRFIIDIMKLAVQPKNNEVKVEILNYIANSKAIENKHAFFQSLINLEPADIFKELGDFDFDAFLQLSLYDSVEYVLRAFDLIKRADAYIQFFLDEVLNYSLENQSSLIGFLNYWETKKEKLSIVIPEGQNAVQIMTIHKAKGLEFPIVIFPYADLDIYREKESKSWFKIDPKGYNGFSEAFINLNKDIEAFSQYGYDTYNKHQAELELDNINLLYVALTRAVEQLYIIGKKDINSKGDENQKTFSGLIIKFLKSIGSWDDRKLHYTFGTQIAIGPSKQLKRKEQKVNTYIQEEFISSSAESHNINVITNSGLLWDTKQKEAIEKGNLIHKIMSNIYTLKDVDFVLKDYLNFGIIDKIQKKELSETITNIVSHPKLIEYYAHDKTSYNEREIITDGGKFLRPDKVVINKNKTAIIIDYKTGLPNPKYQEQLEEYAGALHRIGFSTTKKILVYTNENISVVEC